jgi:ABC-type bacteriocin/lantibiotic exporter with double-glycine peptidase domain
VQTLRVTNVVTGDRLHAPLQLPEATSIAILFLLMKVHLVLVAIHAAVVTSRVFNQVHSGKKENDRGMDV